MPKRPQPPMESVDAGAPAPLLAQVRQLIDAARQRVASAVNAELTQLYWHIGRRISTELLQGQRGEYGKQVVAGLARQLTAEFGKGWSEQRLRHCLRLAEVFADEPILSTVRRALPWPYRKISPCCHRAKPCRPNCTSPLRLPVRSLAEIPINETLLAAPPAAPSA